MANFHQEHVTHSDIAEFAKSKVNLKKEHEQVYRAQAARVRDRIEFYIQENPEVGFVKTILSGSLAKHTALASLNDIDIALYVKADVSPNELGLQLKWIADRLQKTYPSTPIKIDPPCVVIKFSGTDLDVEIMPVLYEVNDHGYGRIWEPYSLKETYTSIPRHIEFIKKRRVQQSPHFAQIVRLLKYWKKVQGLDFRSFLIELLVAEQADHSAIFSNYPDALLSFFNRILDDDLEERVLFTDYFSESDFPSPGPAEVEIWDPVTPDNNVAKDYSKRAREEIVEACERAADAITNARNTTQKGEAIEYWKEIFGPRFSA